MAPQGAVLGPLPSIIKMEFWGYSSLNAVISFVDDVLVVQKSRSYYGAKVKEIEILQKEAIREIRS